MYIFYIPERSPVDIYNLRIVIRERSPQTLTLEFLRFIVTFTTPAAANLRNNKGNIHRDRYRLNIG